MIMFFVRKRNCKQAHYDASYSTEYMIDPQTTSSCQKSLQNHEKEHENTLGEIKDRENFNIFFGHKLKS